MRKIRKCVFAAVLAAALLFTMPGMVSYAETGDAQTENISESITGQEETDDAEEPKSETDVIEGEEPENPEEKEEEEETEPENPIENQEKEGKESENPQENQKEIPEENVEEMAGEDSALMESVGRRKAAVRSGAQSEQTEESIASVTVDGVTSYYDHLDYLRIAWKEAQGKTAVIRILRDVDLNRYELYIDNPDSNFTLEMSEGVTLSGDGGSSGKRGFMIMSAGSLTMKSGTLHNTMSLQGRGIDIRGGSFILEGGTVKTDGSDNWNTAIHAENGSTVLIKGGEIIADKYGLYAGSKSSVRIERGRITAGEKGTAIMLSNCVAAEILDGEFTGESKGIYLEAGSAKISGGTFSGYCGATSGNKTAIFQLTGGTFVGTSESLRGGNGKPINWLEEGCCYYELESGNMVPSASMDNYYWKTSVTVGECNHSLWKDWTFDEEDNHSHVCQGCGKTESGPHQWDENKRCTVCGKQAVASVTAAGETNYYSLLSNAWKAAQGKTATVKIMQNVDLEEDTLEVNDPNSNITLEMAEGVTLERPKNTGCLIHITDGNFTFASGTAKITCGSYANLRDASVILVEGGEVRLKGGMLTNTSSNSYYGCGVKVNGGRLVVNGGEIQFPNNLSVGVDVNGGETVIQGGSITAVSQGVKVTDGKLTVEGEAKLQGTSGYGLFDSNGVSVLYGGIFIGGSGAIYGAWTSNVKQMPGEGYVYYYLDDAGNKTLVTSVSATLKGTVTVAPCDHDYGEWAEDGNGSHSRICKGCGIEETQACNYEYEDAGKDGHVGSCTVCGHQKTQEAHTFTAWSASDTENGYVRTCTACKWQHTAEITQSSLILQAVYDAIEEQNLSATVTGAKAAYEWKLQGSDNVLGTQESYTIPTDLPAGNYTYQCVVTLEDDSEPAVILSYSLSVVQADLEKASVEIAEGEGIFYDGEKKEPDVTVKLGEKTLEKGVDYTVSYTNNMKVGKGMLTITGIGNYAGTVSKNFAIRYYETEAAAKGPGDWCSRAQISAPAGFTISDSLDGEFGDTFYYGTETGGDGAEITYYLKQDGTGYITDAKTIRVKVDTTQPAFTGTGNGIKITDRDAWWQELLSKITFGRYKPQVATVQAADSLSGIDKIYYYIHRTQKDTPLTAEELRKVGADEWKSSDSVTFTLDEEGGYVIYAYAVDKVGNQSAYICSDGIVIDHTPPRVTLAEPLKDGGIKDTSAAPLAQMNEAGNITYILLNVPDSGITAEKILNSTDKGTGSITDEQAGKDIELHFSGLRADTTYYLYAVGTDTAGNINDEIASLSFTTLKSVIAGTVSLAGKEAFGETLTVSANIKTEDYGKVSYQWHRIDENGNDMEIAGAESEFYTLTAEDIGCSIRVEVTADNCSGSLKAATGDKIQKADPPVENMPVNGRVNDTLGMDTFTFTGKKGVVYEYSTDGGNTWNTMEDSAFSQDISDHTKVTGTIEIGNYAHAAGQIQVRSKETATSKAGKALKNMEAFTASLEGSVLLTGTAKYGETLTATVDGVQPGITLIYSFYRDGAGTVIQTGKSNTYTPTVKDIGKHISVKVTAAGYTGALEAQTEGIVQKAEGAEIPGTVTGHYIIDGQTYTYTVDAVAGAEYRMDDGPWQKSNVFMNIRPGSSHMFEARMAETDCLEAGNAKGTGEVTFPKLTPAVPALQYQVEKSENGDVAVTIVQVDGAEYSFDGGTTWGSENKQTGFNTSQTVTLAVRLKETDTHNPSPAQTVAVNLAKGNREAPPAFTLNYEANGETDYTVIIPPAAGCEYSFDGEHWSDDNVKSGVRVGETVTGYMRYKENNDYNTSSAVSDTKTMPKFTVKTPVITPAGGSYIGSVSVTITCGSPDAEIYYTTDGSTPTRSAARYTGAFPVPVPVTVKAIAIKDGLADSAVATASYLKRSSEGSSISGEGNSGDKGNTSNENAPNGNVIEGGFSTDQGQGNKENNRNGNTVRLETEAIWANLENRDTSKRENALGSRADTSMQETKQPFIKGENGKIGWDVIRSEEEQAIEGSIINVDMNGTTVVPGDIFDSIKGRDITITFDMGGGIFWSVDGKSITTDKAGNIDFSVKTGTNAIPVDIVNNVTGECYSIQISLSYEGEFGFTAVLSVNLGKENQGYIASLYYYKEGTGELEFICSDKVAEDGTVSLAFTHASDYVIAIDEEEESGNVTEPVQPEEQDEDSTEAAEENLQTEQARRLWWLIVAGALVILMGIGVFFLVKKKNS